jgi:arabinogalactan endo-1,4-beta-galactosidase
MFLGADLSYVNEVEDRGGVFTHNGCADDPFRILKAHGANIVRVRLWHTPTWTAYSNFADVQRTLRRAKALDMATMLDIHYSDTWADPGKQIIPAAWASLEQAALQQAVYDYTLGVLLELHGQGLMPEFVQVGNEINTEILMPGHYDGGLIRWERNAALLNAGIRAVREAGARTSSAPQVMLHIAQPENILPWFDAAQEAGVTDFDAIGLSYYPKWSTYAIDQCAQIIDAARERYGKSVMIVEAAYPWTLDEGRAESHLLAADAVTPDYPATPEGQRQFLLDLTQAVCSAGGSGVIYWEPAWISTPQAPSIWENATLFDYDGAAHAGIDFLQFNECADRV